MKNIVLYFTSTGNSLTVAKDLAAGLGDTQLIGIPKASRKKQCTVEADTVGLVFPVYCWGLPKIVADFAKAVSIRATYVYAVTTYGGCPGDTLLQLEKILKTKNVTLRAGFGLHFPGNYTPLYGAKPQDKQEKLFAKANAKLSTIIQIVKKQETTKIEWGPWLVSALIRVTRFYDLFVTHVNESDKSFFVQDTCDGCGICAKVCPVDNINVKNKKPTWQHNCENCLACLQWCPQEAIQYGKSTIGRKRYRHPAITLKELLAQKE